MSDIADMFYAVMSVVIIILFAVGMPFELAVLLQIQLVVMGVTE